MFEEDPAAVATCGTSSLEAAAVGERRMFDDEAGADDESAPDPLPPPRRFGMELERASLTPAENSMNDNCFLRF